MDIARCLFAGEDVAFRDYPVLCAYYHIKPAAHLRRQLRPARPLSFWIPPNAAGDADRYIAIGLAAEPLLTLRERYPAGASIEQCAELSRTSTRREMDPWA